MLLLTALISVPASAQQASQPGTTFYPAKPLSGGTFAVPSSPSPLAIPLFLTGDRFTSVLTLSNVASDPTYADLLLRDASGTVLLTKRVTFQPHSKQELDLGDLLAKVGSTAARGSVLVQPSLSLAGPVILGTLAMTYTGSAAPTYLDEEISAPTPSSSPTLVGVADPSDGAPVLAVTSLASAVQHVKVECLGEQGASSTRQITLIPGQTSIAPACGSRDAEVDALQSEGTGKAQGATGMRITSDGAPGSFAAFALAPHTDEDSRSFSSVLFSDPQAAHSPGIVFAGVPVGAATLLPVGEYIPRISLANFSAAPAHVSITFAHNASGAAANPRVVGSVTLPPNSSREVALANLSGDPDLQNSFLVSSDAASGLLAAKFVAGGGPPLRRVELQAKDERDTHNGGVHPWSIENGTESTLLLFNHGAATQKFAVSVGGSETWQKTYTLAKMQTQSVSLRDLIESRTKDDTGRTLPPTLQTGEVNWFVPDSTESSGRLLHTDRAAGMARNYSCGYSGLLCGASVNVITTYLADGTIAEFGTVTAITCTSGTPNACNGQQTGTGNFSTTWTSGTPSVASISGYNTVSSVNLLGNSAGTSGVGVRLQSSYCSAGGGGTATVGVPTTIRLVGSLSRGFSSCMNGTAQTHARTIWAQIVDNATPPVAFTANGITVGESISTGKDDFHWGTPALQTGSGKTTYENAPLAQAMNGVYSDAYFNCDAALNACLNGTGGGLQSMLTQTLTYGGTTLPVKNALIETCNGFTVNGK